MRDILKKYFQNYEHKNSLFLYGEMNTGKTTFFNLLMKALLEQGKMFLRLYMPNFIIQFHKNWYDETVDKKMDILTKVPILLIDDFGFGTMSEHFRNDILLSIIEYRSQNNLPIIINTSLLKEELIDYLKIKNDKQNMKVATKIINKLNINCQYYTLTLNSNNQLKNLYQ
ncbi:hypothetical protein [Candidatus Phytoplasma fraxini]|uniref:DNA replication protein n=1 Tax=Ash yellows phytoplasma TaxID=35780 RepID=A0ABZ2U9F2_ASHYP